jgi:hypothetical protein
MIAGVFGTGDEGSTGGGGHASIMPPKLDIATWLANAKADFDVWRTTTLPLMLSTIWTDITTTVSTWAWGTPLGIAWTNISGILSRWDIFTKGKELITKLFDGFTITPELISKLQSAFRSFSSTILTVIDPSGLGGNIIYNVIDAMQSKMEYATAMFQWVGEMIGWGLEHGLRLAWDAVWNLIDWIGEQIPEWLKKALGIASPSKIMIDIGYNIGAGLAEGIEATAGIIYSSAAGMVQAVSAPLGYLPAYAMNTSNNNSSTTNYNLSVNSGLPPNVVAGSFAAMAVKARR